MHKPPTELARARPAPWPGPPDYAKLCRMPGHLESEADDRLTGLDRVTRVLTRRADVYGGRSAPSLQETGEA